MCDKFGESLTRMVMGELAETQTPKGNTYILGLGEFAAHNRHLCVCKDVSEWFVCE